MHTPPLSQSEFAQLFQEHARALWCVAVAVLGNRDEAEDVLQESAITGLAKRQEFVRGTSFVHWMGQVVRYTALNEGRRRRIRKASSVDGVQAAARDGAVREDRSEPFDDRVLAALATLDETARTCLLMRTVLDFSYRQISEALQIAEGTAMSHVHRSRMRMRAALLAFERSSASGHGLNDGSGMGSGVRSGMGSGMRPGLSSDTGGTKHA